MDAFIAKIIVDVILGLIPRMTVLQKRTGCLALDALQRQEIAFIIYLFYDSPYVYFIYYVIIFIM